MFSGGPTASTMVRPNDVRAASQGLRKLVAGLDPDAVVVCEAPEVWAEFDAIERVIASAKILMARRVEEARSWERQGFRSVVEQLAGLAGTSIASAKTMLETSKQVVELPATAALMREGELSSAKAQAVVAAAVIAPDAEADLLRTAMLSPLAEVRNACLRARAAVDVAAAHERIRRERRCGDSIDPEGAWNLHVRGPVEVGAEFRAQHEPLVDAMFKAAYAEGRREPREAYAFDAFVELVRRAAGSNARTTETTAEPATKVKSTPARYLGIIRVDHEALTRGAVEGDETCEIRGLGPIPVSVAREMLRDAILKLVITKGVDVANVTHLGRSVTVAQQVALWWQSPECTRLGCTRTQRLENDHRRDWAETHHTRLDESDPLCGPDHDFKTRYGWALVAGKGKRPMVPPDDPRHPNNSPPDER